MSKTCEACGIKLPDLAKYCSQCGRCLSADHGGEVTVTRKRLTPTKWAFSINRNLKELDIAQFVDGLEETYYIRLDDLRVEGDNTIIVTFDGLPVDKDTLDEIEAFLRGCYEDV